jgi:DNA-binding NarL/FixJ family response regulator
MSADVILEQARAAYRRQQWADALALFKEADASEPLGPEDLGLLAWAAGMRDRDDDIFTALERLYSLYLEADDPVMAARAAFMMGFRLLALEEIGRASAWLQRAQDLVQRYGRECATTGWLLLPGIRMRFVAGDYSGAEAEAARALAIGQRCAEPDLVAFARCMLGRAKIRQGDVAGGIGLLDEAMLSASAGQLAPIITGLIYCNVIEECRRIWAVDRAREWTEALSRWCGDQPQLVQFNGICRIHRAEILELDGAWQEAIVEAKCATEKAARAVRSECNAAAAYQEAEIMRLRGEYAKAEELYRESSQWGGDPQPGLALLRQAQGRTEQAIDAMRRALAAASDPLAKARLLPAAVEILLAGGRFDEAKSACMELADIAGSFSTEVLAAMAAHARGAIEMAEGNHASAIAAFRSAFLIWQRSGAPYIAARLRALIGTACRALGDEEGAALEWQAARATFALLGAAPDLNDVEASLNPRRNRTHGGLTTREIEVLKLVAEGGTNKAVASQLGLSDKTVDRHLSNIFDKLGVSSRAAATAYAFQHKLI